MKEAGKSLKILRNNCSQDSSRVFIFQFWSDRMLNSEEKICSHFHKRCTNCMLINHKLFILPVFWFMCWKNASLGNSTFHSQSLEIFMETNQTVYYSKAKQNIKLNQKVHMIQINWQIGKIRFLSPVVFVSFPHYLLSKKLCSFVSELEEILRGVLQPISWCVCTKMKTWLPMVTKSHSENMPHVRSLFA